MHRVHLLAGLDVDKHVRIFDDEVPIAVLGGKLDGVALSVAVHLFGTGP